MSMSSHGLWLVSLFAVIACTIFVVHSLEGQPTEEVITEVWIAPDVQDKVLADQQAREVAERDARIKAAVAAAIIEKANNDAFGFGLQPGLSIATIGLPPPEGAPINTHVAKQASSKAPPSTLETKKPAKKTIKKKEPAAKHPPKKKKKKGIDLAALSHAAFGMIQSDDDDDDDEDEDKEEDSQKRKAALDEEDDLGFADSLSHFAHERAKLQATRIRIGIISTKKTLVDHKVGKKELTVLFASKKVKKAAPKKKKKPTMSTAQREAIRRKKQKKKEAERRADERKMDLLHSTSEKFTGRVVHIRAPTPPRAPKKVKKLKPLECHPPHCLPSAKGTHKKHKKHKKARSSHHFRLRDMKVPKALTIERFDKQIEDEKAWGEKDARWKQHAHKLRHQQIAREHARRAKKRKQAVQRKADIEAKAQEVARDQALEDISHKTDHYWITHGKGWTTKGDKVTPSTKQLKQQLRRLTKMHYARNAMQASLHQAATKIAKKARHLKAPKEHYYASKQQMMHQLLNNDVKAVKTKRDHQHAVRNAKAQRAKAAKQAALKRAERAKHAKGTAKTASTAKALKALADKQAGPTHAKREHRAGSEQDLIRQLMKEDLKAKKVKRA